MTFRTLSDPTNKILTVKYECLYFNWYKEDHVVRVIWKLTINCDDVLTQFTINGSMLSTNNSSLKVSSFHKASSLALVKGKAILPQIHIMWSAFGLATLPCGSITTSIGFFVKFQTSLMNLITGRSIKEGWYTLYHGIAACRLSNCFCMVSVIGTFGSKIGSHTTSYWLSCLVGCCRASYICSRIATSSCEMSVSDMSSKTYFRLRTSMLTWLGHKERHT